MADGYLNFSFQPPIAIVLDRFSGVSDPTIWVYQAECYFNFHGFSKDMWLSLPYLYFDGEALAWFNWLYRNKQFYDWKHFTDKLFYHYRRQTVRKFGLPPVTDLLLQIDANLSRMHRHLDNIHNTLSACSQKFYDAPAHSDFTVSLADKCDIEEVAEQEFVPSLDKDNSNPTENSEVTHTIETLGPMLESKNDLKDDPINYACKMFTEMSNKKIAMKVEHTVRNDSENLASHMFLEMFQTISAVKEEYNDLVMLNMQLGLGIALCSEEMSGMLSTCTYVQLLNKGIIDHFSRLGHASLILTLHLFPPDQFGLVFPFDPGSRLLTTVLRVTRNYVFCVALDNLDHNKLIKAALWYSCIWVGKGQDQYRPGIGLSKLREFGRAKKIQGLPEAFTARYSEQFPDILVSKNGVFLFVIFGVAHISKPTLSYLVFGPGPYLAYDIFAKLPGKAVDVFRQQLFLDEELAPQRTDQQLASLYHQTPRTILRCYTDRIFCTVNVDLLQLQGCSDRCCLITYPNSMTRVWDPGQFWCANSSILKYDSVLSVALSSNYTHFYIIERSIFFYLTTLTSKATGLTWRGNVLVFRLVWHAENKARYMDMRILETCLLKVNVFASLGMPLLWKDNFGLSPVAKYLDSFWSASIMLILAHFYRCKSEGLDTTKPLVSRSTFLILTRLVFSVGLGEQNCATYSIQVVVVFTIGVGIFCIGAGNDLPTRNSMDAKIIVPWIVVWMAGTCSLFIPWYTTLLFVHEEISSANLVFTTTLRICDMVNLHNTFMILHSLSS